MKKTLITLLALGGVAMGTEDTIFDSTLTSSVADITTSTLSGFTVNDWSLFNTVNGGSLTSKTTGSAFSSALRPDINVGTGNSWALSFTISNNSGQDYALSSLTLNAFTFNGNGEGQYTNTNRKFIFAIYEEINDTTQNQLYIDEEARELNGPAKQDSTTIISDPHILIFSFDKEIILSDNDSINLSLVVSDGTTAIDDGCFLGATKLSMSGHTVPEPTTATLSLLALAGLAARRRRR